MFFDKILFSFVEYSVHDFGMELKFTFLFYLLIWSLNIYLFKNWAMGQAASRLSHVAKLSYPCATARFYTGLCMNK